MSHCGNLPGEHVTTPSTQLIVLATTPPEEELELDELLVLDELEVEEDTQLS